MKALLKFSKHQVEWKDVTDFPTYEISPNNGIRNKVTQKPLKGRNWIGYPKVTLMRDGQKHEKRIHKLVAEHYVPNPKGLDIVNHDNSNRSDYRARNLSWMSQSENMKHRWATEKAGLEKEKYGHEHGKDKMKTETMEKTHNQKGRREMKALNKFAKDISRSELVEAGGLASLSPTEYAALSKAEKDEYNLRNSKALSKVSEHNSRGRNSFFARINRAKKMGIKFKKKGAMEYIKIKRSLKKMRQRSRRK